MADNLFPLFTATAAWSRPPLTDSIVIYDDGRSAQWDAVNDSSYFAFEDVTQRYNGRTLRISGSAYYSSDGYARLRIISYKPDGSYITIVSLLQEDGQIGNFPFTHDFLVPTDSTEIKIYFRNNSPASEPYATVTMKAENISLLDTTVVSTVGLNFWKVAESNLPASVTPGTEHIYFTTDGATVKMWISTLTGGLVQVSSGDIISGDVETYDNAYTQANIDERKADIEALQRAGNTITFVTPTDIHVRNEDGDAGRYNQIRDLIMLTAQVPIDYITCCGDIMSYTIEFDGYEPRIEKTARIFNSCRVPWFATRGNHDYNSDDASYGTNPNVADLNASTAYDLIIRNEDWFKSIDSRYNWPSHLEVVFDATNPKGGYFYVDDYAKKHRLIYCNSEEVHDDDLGRPYINAGTLDCFISGAVNTKRQLEFVLNHAMNMTGKTDWDVSFYSHQVPYTDADTGDTSEFHGYGGDQVKIRTVVKAFQEGTALSGYAYALIDTDLHTWISYSVTKDFTSQGPIRVIGWFGGHIHADCYRKVDGLNLCVSTNTCASQRTSWTNDPTPTIPAPARNQLDLAMSLNVWIVNKDTRTVNMIKVGAKENNSVKTSSDISFTY
jgi:hypothetical protein